MSRDPDADKDKLDEYDRHLAVGEILLGEALRKVQSGRVYDAENERVRIKWIRVATQVLAERRKTLEARDLQVLSDRIDEFEERVGGRWE